MDDMDVYPDGVGGPSAWPEFRRGFGPHDRRALESDQTFRRPGELRREPTSRRFILTLGGLHCRLGPITCMRGRSHGVGNEKRLRAVPRNPPTLVIGLYLQLRMHLLPGLRRADAATLPEL
jgi:hypothetical protein